MKVACLTGLAMLIVGQARAEEIGCISTTFRFVGANDKVCVEAFDDPEIPGVSRHISQARTGGIKGPIGLAEDPSRFVISCRQTGRIALKKSLFPLYSPSRLYFLAMQTNRNLCLYASPGNAVWCRQTVGTGVPAAIMQAFLAFGSVTFVEWTRFLLEAERPAFIVDVLGRYRSVAADRPGEENTFKF